MLNDLKQLCFSNVSAFCYLLVELNIIKVHFKDTDSAQFSCARPRLGAIMSTINFNEDHNRSFYLPST